MKTPTPTQRRFNKLLVKLLKRFNPWALNYMDEKVRPKITFWVATHGGSKKDGEEIYYDRISYLLDFIKAWKSDDNKFVVPYFFKMCVNLWWEKLEKKKKLEDESVLHADKIDKRIKQEYIKAASAEDDYIRKEDDAIKLKALKSELKKLLKKCKDILMDFYYKGLQMEDIAKKRKYKNGNVVKTKKSGCLDALRVNVISEYNRHI
jgi:DNA-directed RNA polymerase specialized sigma24 family protein